MADDPIIKFFREDLTEAEEAALLERLSSSVEDALRFGQHAEASYRHYGLPEPKWQGGPPPPGFPQGPGWRLGLWLPLALLTGLSVWGALKYWKGTANNLSASIPESSQVATTLSEMKKNLPIPVKKEIIPDRLPQEPQEQTEEAPSSALAPSQSISEASVPALTPINAAVPNHHPHTNLEVMVKRARPGPVTVRVLGPDGTQAVVLYQGMLQPGNWAFDWNGRLADGGAPPAGTYQIQVVSGAVTLNKPVVLRKQP